MAIAEVVEDVSAITIFRVAELDHLAQFAALQGRSACYVGWVYAQRRGSAVEHHDVASAACCATGVGAFDQQARRLRSRKDGATRAM